MLKMNYEFRKGILFVRLLGNFDKDHYQRNIKKLNELIKEIGITNIVLNIDEIKSIDISGINYILNYYNAIDHHEDPHNRETYYQTSQLFFLCSIFRWK